MKYAAYDAHSIYDVGDTEDAAMKGALDALGSESSPLKTAPISDEFAAHIAAHGWEGKHNSFEIDHDTRALIDTTTRVRDNLDAAAELMDDDLREAIHLDPRRACPHWFLAEYGRRHLEKFGEDFAPATNGAW